MKTSLIALVTMVVTLLAGCAGTSGTSGNDAYIKAHEAHAERAKAEANATAKAQETIALAIASAAKGCETDACRMGAMMTYANIKAQVGDVAKSVAPVIQAPVNEALEWTRTLLGAATNLYSIRIGGAIKLGDMSRGAADKDVLRDGMSTLDIIRDTTK